MTYVVLENCIKCKYTDCVDVCPVDCFHEGPNFLVIDPDECIDCALCEPECPAEAIVAEDDIPAGQEQFLALNGRLAGHHAEEIRAGGCRRVERQAGQAAAAGALKTKPWNGGRARVSRSPDGAQRNRGTRASYSPGFGASACSRATLLQPGHVIRAGKINQNRGRTRIRLILSRPPACSAASSRASAIRPRSGWASMIPPISLSVRPPVRPSLHAR